MTDLTTDQVRGLLCHFDYALAMRFHSVVFAAMAGIPFVSICYSDKVSYLVRELGVEEYSVPYYMWRKDAHPPTKRVLVERFEQMLRDERKIRTQLYHNLAVICKRNRVNRELVQHFVNKVRV